MLEKRPGVRRTNTFVEKNKILDAFGSEITVFSVFNGLLSFTVIRERGLDIGEIFYKDEKVTWERDRKYLLHPDHVNLAENGGTGWLKGFYSAVASIGPELFGTPGEGLTLHGTGSYSPALPDSVRISADDTMVAISGTVPVRGYGEAPVFEKSIKIKSIFGSSALLIEETVKNLTDVPTVLDNGYHLQLAGNYMAEGGRYVLPVPVNEMLLRDSAPGEEDPLRVCPSNPVSRPLRCYQYVPGPVSGLENIDDIKPYAGVLTGRLGITAEMVVNSGRSTAAYVVRPLDCFPRSLIAKEVNENAMFSLEPCRTRPNRMSQKITDGEAFFLQPHASTKTVLLIGVTKDPKIIDLLEKAITIGLSGFVDN